MEQLNTAVITGLFICKLLKCMHKRYFIVLSLLQKSIIKIDKNILQKNNFVILNGRKCLFLGCLVKSCALQVQRFGVCAQQLGDMDMTIGSFANQHSVKKGSVLKSQAALAVLSILPKRGD